MCVYHLITIKHATSFVEQRKNGYRIHIKYFTIGDEHQSSELNFKSKIKALQGETKPESYNYS